MTSGGWVPVGGTMPAGGVMPAVGAMPVGNGMATSAGMPVGGYPMGVQMSPTASVTNNINASGAGFQHPTAQPHNTFISNTGQQTNFGYNGETDSWKTQIAGQSTDVNYNYTQPPPTNFGNSTGSTELPPPPNYESAVKY